MNRLTPLIWVIMLTGTLLMSCRKSDDIPSVPDTPVTGPLLMTGFSFDKAHNPQLPGDIPFRIIDRRITGRIPYYADISDLIPTFTYEGSAVSVAGQLQESGIDRLDFTSPVEYTVVGDQDTSVSYMVDAIYFTGLPMIRIYTDNGEEITSKDDYLNGHATVIGGRDFDDLEGDMKIRGRGHSTWYLHPKKPYQMKFDEENPLLGMSAEKKWIFLAEYSDKSLIRNRLAFEMGYISNLSWTPRCQYSEVFVNDDYRGTYLITEKIEAERIGLDNNAYLLEIDTNDHIEDGDITFYTSTYLFQIKEPEISEGSAAYLQMVDYMTHFEEVLFGADFADSVNGYRKYIDVESTIDWFLINEIAKNVDARDYSSIYFTYTPGNKLRMGPLWDFDLGFGNVDYADSRYEEGFWVYYNHYIHRMFDDPWFAQKVRQRYAYFYQNKAYFMQVINEQAQKLIYAQEENDARWDLFGNYVWPNPVYYDTHIEEVNHLKSWLDVRMDWLNEAFDPSFAAGR